VVRIDKGGFQIRVRRLPADGFFDEIDDFGQADGRDNDVTSRRGGPINAKSPAATDRPSLTEIPKAVCVSDAAAII